jgi:glutathione synthase/RimK-type ligase-like ATP-grasp enzyme
MSWVIVVDNLKDFPNADTPHKVITTSEYIARPKLFETERAKVVNLSRSYAYQSKGYYASLLGEARGHRVLPEVQTMLELREAKLYEHAIPELEDALNRCYAKTRMQKAEGRILVCFGVVREAGFESFGKLLFDWYRCPAIEVSVEVDAVPSGAWASIEKIRPRPIVKLDPEETQFFRDALHTHTKREWRDPKARLPARYSLAVLHDPEEVLPPSNIETLKYLGKVAERLSVDVEPITKKDLSDLAEFDALFIRETTSIDNHTYRFARRAAQEGMPVIDDPISMIRCTNKVYLMERMAANNVPTPPTVMLAAEEDLPKAIAELGLPLVVKIPDGSFSRGVHKVETEKDLRKLFDELYEDTDLLIAQKFMPTNFDWRVGILEGEPLFVCQYMMFKGHWQIVKHENGSAPKEGRFKTVPLAEAPPKVIEIAVNAARTIGDGLYGVDLKETPEGVFVIEINDNPNLEHGVEDICGKDEIWEKVLKWFIKRIDA